MISSRKISPFWDIAYGLVISGIFYVLIVALFDNVREILGDWFGIVLYMVIVAFYLTGYQKGKIKT